MKIRKLMGLAVALALGNAAAANLAGTQITNQADATFTVGGNTQTTNSTPVKTTVNAVPSYTITANGTEASPADTQNVAVSTTATYGYVITNTGNTFIQVNVGVTYGTGSSTVTNVKIDGNAVTPVASGSTPTSTTKTATIAPGKTLNLSETFTVPSDAGVYYTSPVGVSINYTNSAVDSNNAVLSTAPTTMDVTGFALADTDNVNRTNATTTTPNFGTPTTNTGTVVPTPGTGGPTNTTPGNGTGTPGSGNGPGESTGPGYNTRPDGSGVPVVVQGNNQYAFPRADTDTSADSVTMTGTVGNPNPVATDYTLTPGANYTYNPTTGIFTGNDGTPAAGTTVTFKDASGTVLTGGTTGPVLTVPANSTANYQTVITYPDTESASAKPGAITVPVTINGAGPVNYVVMPPNLTFGNSNGAAAGVDANARTVTLDQPSIITCVVFPMDVANTGAYAESYDLSASTNVTGGSVKFVRSLPTAQNTAGVLSSAACTTVDSATAVTNTGAIEAGKEQTVYAVVKVPAGTAVNTYTVSQQAKGTFSGTIKTFNTDTVTLQALTGTGLTITKLVNDKAENTANPGDTLTYTIKAENKFSGSIYGLIIRDPSTGGTGYQASNLFGPTGFVTPTKLSATVTGVTGTVLYRINGGAWISTAPTVDGGTTKIEVGVDTNGANGGDPDGNIDVNDVFPANATLTITLQGTVK